MKKKMIFDVVSALIEVGGKLLVCQRLKSDRFGSLWEFPGGKVECGEDKEAALFREIKEELDIDIDVGKLVGTFEDEIPSMKINVFLYQCYVKAGNERCRECQDLRWVSLDEAKDLTLAPVDKKIHSYLSSLS